MARRAPQETGNRRSARMRAADFPAPFRSPERTKLSAHAAAIPHSGCRAVGHAWLRVFGASRWARHFPRRRYGR